jgi:hypothetical protein
MKHWWQSKTLWLNGLVAMLLLAEKNITALQGALPDHVVRELIFFLPIMNMWLRLVTKDALSITPIPPSTTPSPPSTPSNSPNNEANHE